MTNINSLFGKKNNGDTNQTQPVASDVAGAAQANSTDEGLATQAADEQVVPTQQAAPVRKGLGFLGKPASQKQPDSASVSTGSTEAAARPKLAGIKVGQASQAEPVVPAADDGFDLDDIANLDVSDMDESRDSRSTFPDEIGATEPIPERFIPEGADEQMRSFVSLMDQVYTIGHDPQLLGNVIRSIMIELQRNPHYINSDWKKSLVQPDDVRVWIRNMREVMGLAKVAKAEAKAKRGNGRKKKEQSSSEMLDDLASLGFVIEE